MPKRIRVLGQIDSATTEKVLYTVSVDHCCVISSISICNPEMSGGSITADIRIEPASVATPLANQYLLKNCTVPDQETLVLTMGITLEPGDIVYVLSSLDTTVFQAFGEEFPAMDV